MPERYLLKRDLADVERHAGNWELSEGYLEDAEEDAGARVGALVRGRAPTTKGGASRPCAASVRRSP